jgi:hypothetical protein
MLIKGNPAETLDKTVSLGQEAQSQNQQLSQCRINAFTKYDQSGVHLQPSRLRM